MSTLTPTKDTGGASKVSPAMYAEPERRMTDEDLAEVMAVSGLNGPFLADALSAYLTHERCGVHLYRSVAARSNNPMLRSKYEELGEETARHVEILEDVIAGAGGNPSYVSPMARAMEGSDAKLLESTYLLSGAIDPMTAEMAMLDAVLLAETIDHANWSALASLTAELPGGQLRESLEAAVAEVEPQEDDHLEWARTTRARLTMLQASSSMLAKAGAKLEEMVAEVRSWLSDDKEVAR